MKKNHNHHQIGPPGVYLQVKPAHIGRGHDVFNALKSLIHGRAVIDKKQNARKDLAYKKEKRHAAQSMKPADITGQRVLQLFFDRSIKRINIRAFLEPISDKSFHNFTKTIPFTTLTA